MDSKKTFLQTEEGKKILCNLAKSKDRAMREIAAENSNTPKAVLKRLATDIDKSIWLAVAQNVSADSTILSILAEGEDWWRICYEIAMHPNTSKNTLAKLAEHEDAGVRSMVASNPNAFKTTLTKLATDSLVIVRNAVAKNPNTPDKVRRKMK